MGRIPHSIGASRLARKGTVLDRMRVFGLVDIEIRLKVRCGTRQALPQIRDFFLIGERRPSDLQIRRFDPNQRVEPNLLLKG